MCFGNNDTPPAAPPPPPPPAPPAVLDQSAPQTSAPKQAQQLKYQATGTKNYRTSGLGITDTASTANSGGTGLGISM